MIGDFLMRQTTKEREADRMALVGWTQKQCGMDGASRLKAGHQLFRLVCQAHIMQPEDIGIFHTDRDVNAPQSIKRA